jgi:hypothetical protein
MNSGGLVFRGVESLPDGAGLPFYLFAFVRGALIFRVRFLSGVTYVIR